MVDIPYYQGDHYLRMNNDMGMYYQPPMYPVRSEFNCAPYLPQRALAQRYPSPLDLTNMPSHNYINEPPAVPYPPPCTPMSQNSYCIDQPDSPQDISPFHTPPQNMCYYSTSSDAYTANSVSLQNEMNTNNLHSTQSTQSNSDSTESEELNKDDMKNMMSKQIIAIIEQQGPTANGKRKRIKKGTLTESQKVFLRRERNRVAATKCREKRKQQSSITKYKYEEYSEKNQEIKMEIERLERQREYLLSILETHSCIKNSQLYNDGTACKFQTEKIKN